MDFFVNWFANGLGLATPYALASLGLIVSERAGVLSLTAEGLMSVGALAGVMFFTFAGGHPVPSLLVGMAAAAVVSVPFAFLVIVLRVNQIIAGLAIVFSCQGLTDLIGVQDGLTNQPITGLGRMPLWPLSDIPVLGRIFFDQDLIVYLLVPIFFAVSFVLMRSMVGLRLRAVGDNPEAADAAGVGIALYRFLAVIAGSSLVGLAGGYLSVVNTKVWIDDLPGGRGWIAIALVIFARWRPWRALGGALLFGAIEALVPRLATTGLKLPQYFVFMTPYLVTLAVMIWVAMTKRGELGAPAALGIPHLREERR